ncbi:MAG: hypothetical protein KGO05_03245 [Chloroflexota bacterium]|nr:hypothetical protein [Chloroflexota bacterium]
MPDQPARSAGSTPATAETDISVSVAPRAEAPAPGEMPCPICGALMPDLKGGKATICPNCGFKDSCCF